MPGGMPGVPDPYRALGLGPDATLEQIKAAHRRLAKRFHPDRAGGDTERFLAVQHAYQVLSDPLRRREWDRQHPAGPVRADEGARRATGRGAAGGASPGASPRRSPRARSEDPGASAPAGSGSGSNRAHGTGGTTRGRAGGDDERARRRTDRSGSGRPPEADHYTWSAGHVPWWEEGHAGRRGEHQGAPRPAADPAAPPSEPGGSGPGRGDPAAGPRAGGEPAADFDVYSRSSGAAWSMAARAYFRRSEADLARGAAEPYAHRWTTPAGAPPRRRTAAEAARRTAPDRGTSHATAKATATSRPDSSGAGSAGGAFSRAAPAGSTTGPSAATQATARRGPASWPSGAAAAGVRIHPRPRVEPWPTVTERVVYATVGWLPLAFLIAYGGGSVSGCDLATAACPGFVPPLQAILLVGILAVLALAPRLAYYAAAAGLGLGALGLAVASLAALAGLPGKGDAWPPLFVVGAVLAMLLVYVGALLLTDRDRPVPRPWRRPHRIPPGSPS